MICFNGFNESMVTFNAADGLKVGDPVKISANSTVAAGATGNAVCGIARSVREGIASVQMNGYVKMDYSGTAPSLGVTTICCDGDGGVKSGTGTSVIVVEVDTDASTVGFIL